MDKATEDLLKAAERHQAAEGAAQDIYIDVRHMLTANPWDLCSTDQEKDALAFAIARRTYEMVGLAVNLLLGIAGANGWKTAELRLTAGQYDQKTEKLKHMVEVGDLTGDEAKGALHAALYGPPEAPVFEKERIARTGGR